VTISLRFVTCNDPVSAAIRWAEDYWASHVEAVLPDGYLGAHANGGTLVRPKGYDKSTLLREAFVTIPADDVMTAKWETFLRSKVGTPYDFSAILGFVLRDALHQKGHCICSALQNQALQACEFWSAPSAIPSSETSPRDLMIKLSGRAGVAVPTN
jgi:hypothetical protein